MLHFVLDVVHEDTAQLLDVVLHERVQGFPAEGPGQLLGAHRFLRELQVVEDALQAKGNTLDGIVCFGGQLIDGATQLVREEQRL